VEGRRWPVAGVDDAWVRQAVSYLTALRACRGPSRQRRLAEEMPAVAQAHALHQSDPPLLRWAVEARILAAEPFPDIARKCALTPETVEAYEQLFFAVLDRLESSTWVACQVIGRKAHVGMTAADLDVWWKLVGYGFGPIALDIVIDHTTDRPHAQTPTEAEETVTTVAAWMSSWRKFQAMKVLPVTPETALQVIQVLAQLEQRRTNSPQDQSGSSVPHWVDTVDLDAEGSAPQPPGGESDSVLRLALPSPADSPSLPTAREVV
jgi:hypothetical protein